MPTFLIPMTSDAARKAHLLLRAFPDAPTHRLRAGIEVGKRGRIVFDPTPEGSLRLISERFLSALEPSERTKTQKDRTTQPSTCCFLLRLCSSRPHKEMSQ